MGRGGAHTCDKMWDNLIKEHTQNREISAILGEALPRGRDWGKGRRPLKWLAPQFLPTSTNLCFGEFSDGWMKNKNVNLGSWKEINFMN